MSKVAGHQAIVYEHKTLADGQVVSWDELRTTADIFKSSVEKHGYISQYYVVSVHLYGLIMTLIREYCRLITFQMPNISKSWIWLQFFVIFVGTPGMHTVHFGSDGAKPWKAWRKTPIYTVPSTRSESHTHHPVSEYPTLNGRISIQKKNAMMQIAVEYMFHVQ